MNAQSTFQRMMDDVLKRMEFARVYLEDVVIFSKTFVENIEHWETVTQSIADHGMKIKVPTCSFAQQRVDFLGHVVAKNGAYVDPKKIDAIQSFPRPKNASQLRSFLGISGYYQRFVSGFASTSACLHVETSAKAKGLKRTKHMGKALIYLIEKHVTPAVLPYSRLDSPFVVETDASSTVIDAKLSETQVDGKIHRVQYVSRKMSPTEKNYSKCGREALAVIFALMKFCVYLPSTDPFNMITKHQALKVAFVMKVIHGRLARWMDFLADFEFQFIYRAGQKKKAADFLSRNSPEASGYFDEGNLALVVHGDRQRRFCGARAEIAGCLWGVSAHKE